MSARKIFNLLAILALLLLYIFMQGRVFDRPMTRVQEEMHFAIPPVVQLIMTGGDKYLAANIGAFRAVTVGVFQLKPETYRVLADTQVVAAQMNPFHEDNYYTAAAILPWNGEYSAGQRVLQLASNARTTDALPSFFHGFNRFYFEQDYLGAAEDLRLAASRSDEVNKRALLSIAAKWTERGVDAEVALQMIKSMAAETQSRDLRRLLEARITRLEGLLALRTAASRYRANYGHSALSIDRLVEVGLLRAIPVDPMGKGYALDADGVPVLVR